MPIRQYRRSILCFLRFRIASKLVFYKYWRKRTFNLTKSYCQGRTVVNESPASDFTDTYSTFSTVVPSKHRIVSWPKFCTGKSHHKNFSPLQWTETRLAVPALRLPRLFCQKCRPMVLTIRLPSLRPDCQGILASWTCSRKAHC